MEVLDTLREKIIQCGIKSAYVNIGVTAGRIWTIDQVRVIDAAIENLKKNR